MKDFWDIHNGKRMWQVCQYFKHEKFKIKKNVIVADETGIRIIIQKRINDEWNREVSFNDYLYERYLLGEICCYLSNKEGLTYNFYIPDFDDHLDKHN